MRVLGNYCGLIRSPHISLLAYRFCSVARTVSPINCFVVVTNMLELLVHLLDLRQCSFLVHCVAFWLR